MREQRVRAEDAEGWTCENGSKRSPLRIRRLAHGPPAVPTENPMLSLPILASLLLSLTAAGDASCAQSIPEHALWVVHLDVQAFKATALWQVINEHGLDGESLDAIEGLAELEKEFGLDPRKDLLSATVYGMGPDQQQIVAVLRTTGRIDAALSILTAQPNHRELRSGALSLHSWIGESEDESFFAHVLPIESDGESDGDDKAERIVVLSKDLESAAHGVLVLQGRERSLAEAEAPAFQVAPREGSFFFVAFGAVESLPGFGEGMGPHSRIGRLVRGGRIDLGESGGSLYASLALLTDDSQAAQDVADMAEGLAALARLAAGSADELPPQLLDLVRSLDVDTSGREVRVEFRYDSRKLLNDLKELEHF